MRSLFAAVLVGSAMVLVFRVDRLLARPADLGRIAAAASAGADRLGDPVPQREPGTEAMTTQRERTRHVVRGVEVGWGGLDVCVEFFERETERTDTRVRVLGR